MMFPLYPDDPPEFTGPTVEARVTRTQYFMAADYYGFVQQIAEQVAETGEIRVTFDWNGLNARPYDMSFVPMVAIDRGE